VQCMEQRRVRMPKAVPADSTKSGTGHRGRPVPYGLGNNQSRFPAPEAVSALYSSSPWRAVKSTCWSCPVVPPTALPNSPNIQYQ
jgi:hypothetical protein